MLQAYGAVGQCAAAPADGHAPVRFRRMMLVELGADERRLG